MAAAADGRISLSAAGRLRGAMGLAGRNWRLVKFCDGEMMGTKLNVTRRLQQAGACSINNVKKHVCMSLTTNVAAAPGESKVSYLKNERRHARTHKIAHCCLAHI